MGKRENSSFPSMRQLLSKMQLLTTAVVLLACSAAFIANDVLIIRDGKQKEMLATANILGYNLQSSLEFKDDRDARKVLDSLSQFAEVFQAKLYDENGQLFSSYESKSNGEVNSTLSIFNIGNFTIEHEIKRDGKSMGKLVIEAYPADVIQRMLGYLGIAICVFALGLSFSIVVAKKFQNRLTQTIETFIFTIHSISESTDYSLRIPKTDEHHAVHELELLAASFNHMLSEVQSKDMTIQKANEELEFKVQERTDELLKTQQELVQAGRLTSLGEMAAGIAHEINNPLAIIAGKCAILIRRSKEGGVTPEKLREDLEKIDKMINRITKIIKGLRSFARDGSQDPFEIASLKSIVEDAVELCSSRFKSHGVELIVGDIVDIEFPCRATQLGQVLFNLLGNGHDAIQNLDQKWIKIESKMVNNQYLEISVTDSGSGIPMEIQKKIMQPFFTTKEVGKGTGLGLSISKGIIEVHHGEFVIDNQCENTRFVVRLPLKQEMAA